MENKVPGWFWEVQQRGEGRYERRQEAVRSLLTPSSHLDVHAAAMVT